MADVRHRITCPLEWCAAAAGKPCKDRRGIPLTYQHKAREAATTAQGRDPEVVAALRGEAT